MFSAVVDSPVSDIPALSVSDCLAEEVRMEDVDYWLRKLRCDVSRLQGRRLHAKENLPKGFLVGFHPRKSVGVLRYNFCALLDKRLSKID